MNKTIGIIIAVAVVVLGAGVYTLTSKKTGSESQNQTPMHTENDGHTMEEHMGSNNNSMENMDHSMMTNTSTSHGAKLAGTRIDVQNLNNLKPGEVTLALKFYGSDGHEFGPDDLQTAHDELMHLILVRDDATNFQHIHPKYVNGRWTVKTTIAEQGVYNMYIDTSPKEEAASILYVPLTIGGKTAQASFPNVSANLSTTVDGVSVQITPKTTLKTKEHTNITFSLTRNNQPVTNIDPYLGAFGHVVVLRHGDAQDYLHAHPLTETKPTNGKVEFQAEFPAKGTYTMYAQFQIGGKVTTFPITLTVNEEGVAPEGEKASEHSH